jgi:hypothetical protein
MTRYELLEALQRLGELILQKAQIVIAGGAALNLGEYIERGTGDSAIRQVALEKGLSPHWLNDGVKAFGDVLPDDFDQRTDRIGTFGDVQEDDAPTVEEGEEPEGHSPGDGTTRGGP